MGAGNNRRVVVSTPDVGTEDYAPYQIQLDDHDGLIFAPQDSDVCIRLLQDGGMSDRSTPAEAK